MESKTETRTGHKSAGTSVTEVRIVEAAAQLFAHHGYKGTTTREIAQLADLNEATLFRYFPRKPELFWAAVKSHVGRVKLARDTQISLPQLHRLLHVAAFELPQADKMIREHLGPIFDMVCAYFKRCGEKGTMRKVEPSLATLGLIGAVTAHHGLCLLFTEREPPYTNDQQALAYALLWLNGLLPGKDGSGAADPGTSLAL
jgi:AcrR family transcriptional regulator